MVILYFIIIFHAFVISFHISIKALHIPPLISFSTINNISTSVKTNFTLVFFKAACHANPGEVRKQAKFIYFKKHILKVLKYSSEQ